MNQDTPSGSMTYEVYLRQGEAAGPEVESPVETTRIDFYDSGIWVSHDAGGRDFFPWDRVDLIRERPVRATETAGDDEATVAGEEAAEPGIPEEDPGPLA